MIKNLTIGSLTIDCADAGRARDFYARLMEWDRLAACGCPAVKADNGLVILFAEPDIPYVAPVWPEQPDAQQKQMHLDFTVDDVPAAVEKAISLGATIAAAQYGGQGFVTMLDTEGHPFCICKQHGNTQFDRYYEEMGYGAIPDVSINIDCEKYDALRGFYARLTDWDQGFHQTALVPPNRMVVHFMECDGDFEYIPPVWPGQPGTQQKQMHFNFQADDLQLAVDEAIRHGATKAAAQYGEGCITMLDTEGHPFCLCEREG